MSRSGRKAGVAGVVLAGGRSTRFGSPKAFAHFEGRCLVDWGLAALDAQCAGPVAISTREPEAFASYRRPCLVDHIGDGAGPLAGLHAAMQWAGAEGHELVLTVPVDVPLLPVDLAQRLSDAIHTEGEVGAAIAASAGRTHPVCGVWQAGRADALETFVRGGNRRVGDWAAACGARVVAFPSRDGLDPFFNINRPGDLAALARLRAGG